MNKLFLTMLFVFSTIIASAQWSILTTVNKVEGIDPTPPSTTEVYEGDVCPTTDTDDSYNDAMVSGTSIGSPAQTGKLSSQDKEALEAQIRGLNSERQQAENRGDAVKANELAANIAKIEKMLNA